MDRELVERAKGGDHDAFSEICRLSIRRLFAVARHLVIDEWRSARHRVEAATRRDP